MTEFFERLWTDWVLRIDGPMAFRFVMQPVMSVALGVRAGLRDARAGKPPYLWAVVRQPERRRELTREHARDVAKVFVLAVVLDVVYQAAVLKAYQPLEALAVGLVLAVIPYGLVRGPTTRWARRRRKAAGGSG